MQSVEFKKLDDRGKSDWLAKYAEYMKNSLPALPTNGFAWTEADNRCFEEGLRLIAAFNYCSDFVHQSLLFKDYSRRADRLRYYLGRIQKDVDSLLEKPLLGAVSDEKKKVKRGRPKKTEADKKEDMNAPVMQAITYPKGMRWHLDQLGFLLSPGLTPDVSLISSLRSTSAIEAEIAKDLAYKGKPQSAIAVHSEAALEAMRSYKLIYERVDLELANLYAGYLESEEMKHRITLLCSGVNVSVDDVLSQIKGHWEKMGKPAYIPEKPKAETTEEEKERKKRYHNIRSYILRKDGKITRDRVEKIRKYIAEAKQLGFDTSAFEVVLHNVEEKLKDVREAMLFA